MGLRITLLSANLFKQISNIVSTPILRVVCPCMSQGRKSKIVLAGINSNLGKSELGVGTRPLLFAVCLG